MPNVILNDVEIYHDCRTEAQWNTVAKNIPQGFMCVAFVTENNETVAKIKIGDGATTFSNLPYIGGDIDMDDVTDAITTALTNYYTSAQTDTAIANAISTALSSVYSLKGRVDTVNDLPASGNKTGDVYMVGEAQSLQKDEYYWTGTAWEFFGRTIDMSTYYTKAEVDALLQGYVQAEVGKGLSSNDYTTAEKTKLAGLENYDDTAVKQRISNIEADYLKSTDTLILNCKLSTSST